MQIPWTTLERTHAAAEVIREGQTHGYVKLAMRSGRTQRVSLTLTTDTESAIPVVQISSKAMNRDRALTALVSKLRPLPPLSAEEREFDETDAADHGRRWLALLAHNEHLRGVALHLTEHELLVSMDLVCLGDTIDATLLTHRIARLAEVADGLELRITGADVF